MYDDDDDVEAVRFAVEDNSHVDLRMNQMQVRMSYWPRYAKPPMELHAILADSTDLPAGQRDYMWTNRRYALGLAHVLTD